MKSVRTLMRMVQHSLYRLVLEEQVLLYQFPAATLMAVTRRKLMVRIQCLDLCNGFALMSYKSHGHVGYEQIMMIKFNDE